MTAPTSTQIPGYVVGTWDIDPVHSDVSFTVRHMMVSKVRGRLGTFSGEIVTAPQFSDSTVTATVDASLPEPAVAGGHDGGLAQGSCTRRRIHRRGKSRSEGGGRPLRGTTACV